MGAYTGNIGAMEEEEAIAFIAGVESQQEVEVLFRLEVMGHDRDAVLLAGIRRYWQLNDFPPVRPPMGLNDLRRIWRAELQDPETFRMYQMLVRRHGDEAMATG
jgi:hypothetical protein